MRNWGRKRERKGKTRTRGGNLHVYPYLLSFPAQRLITFVSSDDGLESAAGARGGARPSENVLLDRLFSLNLYSIYHKRFPCR